jgi:CheY-like chemotaxis protein
MPASGKINILVVDDLPGKLLALETVLSDLGENVVTAQSGREALRRLLEQDFAVILLDVNMPDIDGLETAALIRQRKKTKHTPIIFVTAFDDEKHLARGYSLGAVDYILAPASPDVLRTKVGVFVDLFRMTEQIKLQAEERVAVWSNYVHDYRQPPLSIPLMLSAFRTDRAYSVRGLLSGSVG